MNPLFQFITGLLTQRLLQQPGVQTMWPTHSPEAVRGMVESVVKQVAKEPEVQNATNAENPLRSRVVAGSVGSIVLAATMLIGDINAGTLDLTNAETLAAIGVLATAGYALWGRLKSGLKPMWSRWFGE